MRIASALLILLALAACAPERFAGTGLARDLQRLLAKG